MEASACAASKVSSVDSVIPSVLSVTGSVSGIVSSGSVTGSVSVGVSDSVTGSVASSVPVSSGTVSASSSSSGSVQPSSRDICTPDCPRCAENRKPVARLPAKVFASSPFTAVYCCGICMGCAVDVLAADAPALCRINVLSISAQVSSSRA